MTHRLDVSHDPEGWTVDQWLLFTSPFGTGQIMQKQLTGSYGLGHAFDSTHLVVEAASHLAYASVGAAMFGPGAFHKAKAFLRLRGSWIVYAGGPMAILGPFFILEALSNPGTGSGAARWEQRQQAVADREAMFPVGR